MAKAKVSILKLFDQKGRAYEKVNSLRPAILANSLLLEVKDNEGGFLSAIASALL